MCLKKQREWGRSQLLFNNQLLPNKKISLRKIAQNKRKNKTDLKKEKRRQGAEFVVSFFSGSRPLALKSSLKSHQMTTFLGQN